MGLDLHNPFKGMNKYEITAVIAGAGGITAFLVYRHHASTGSWNPWSKGSTANSDNTATQVDPVTGLAYSMDNITDPATGLSYLAEADQYGSVSAAEAASPAGAYGQSTATGSGIPVNPASPASTGSVNTVGGTSVYTSNAAWAQAATAGLTDVGYSGTEVAAALGDFLTQTPLSPDEAKLVRTAIAEYGPAPTGNLQVIAAPASKPAPPGKAPETSPESSITVSTTTNDLSVRWSPVGGASKYEVALSNGHTAQVSGESAVFSVGTAGKSGSAKVRAGNSAGWGPYSATKPYKFSNKG